MFSRPWKILEAGGGEISNKGGGWAATIIQYKNMINSIKELTIGIDLGIVQGRGWRKLRDVASRILSKLLKVSAKHIG